MYVCAHGNVAEYCAKHNMIVVEQYDGDIEKYRGSSNVLVTDREMSKAEYYFFKGILSARRVELVSTRHVDSEELSKYVTQKKQKSGGRLKFGFKREGGKVIANPEKIAVARKIIALRDSGYTLLKISNHPDVHNTEGKKLSISTVQEILKNRKEYEERE